MRDGLECRVPLVRAVKVRFDRVVFGGLEHTVVAIAGTTVRLLSAAGEPSVVLASYLFAAADFEAAVRFPEMVQVAQVLTDPDWRRHVAMVELHHLDNFYRHTAKVLGADREGFITDRGRVDPLCEWAQDLRTRHAATRARFWSDLQLNHSRYGSIRRPFPESRHFT
ncbi:hypothetical protein ACWD5Q_23870 [Streptomyces sp. NPDC002513]